MSEPAEAAHEAEAAVTTEGKKALSAQSDACMVVMKSGTFQLSNASLSRKTFMLYENSRNFLTCIQHDEPDFNA